MHNTSYWKFRNFGLFEDVKEFRPVFLQYMPVRKFYLQVNNIDAKLRSESSRCELHFILSLYLGIALIFIDPVTESMAIVYSSCKSCEYHLFSLQGNS